MEMTTKIPLSRHTASPLPTRPVFPRQPVVQEELLLPVAADHHSPSMQIASLFEAPGPEPSPSPSSSPSPISIPASTSASFRAQRATSRPTFNPSLSVGQQFLHARTAQGWSIEDVAFQTHIPHTLLREMENDDLSNFANLTYAKGFLKLYSRHLGLDLSDYLEQFDTSVISDVTGHEYIQTASIVRSLSAPAIAPDANGNPRARLLGIGVLTGVAAILIFVFFKFSHGSVDPSPAPAPASRATGSSESSETSSHAGGAQSQIAVTDRNKGSFAPTSNKASAGAASRAAGPETGISGVPRAEVISN